MTRLAIAFVVWFPTSAYSGDDPKTPPTQLQGVWQEPLRPGEDPSARYRFTFTATEVTILFDGQVLRGTFVAEAAWDEFSLCVRETNHPTIVITITAIEGNGQFVKGDYRGIFRLESGQLCMRFNPPWKYTASSSSRAMDLAPVTLALNKVKK